MDRRVLLCWLAWTAPLHAGRRRKLDKKACAAIERKMKRLESRLRASHSAKQGRNLRRRARELQLKRFRQCR